MSAVLRLVALMFGLALSAASFPQADALQEVSRLLKQRQHAQALERVNQYLSSRPRDAQGRFLKGLILAEQNKSAEAIEVFTKLSQDFPELPEPYNNLAVLYAAQGQYEKARQALETSIRTHPSYATAYENLGDVYTKLASQAYDKALQLDSTNTAAQTKLSLVRELMSGPSRPARAPARTEPVRIAEAPPPAAAPAAKAPAAANAKAAPAAEAKSAAPRPAAAAGPDDVLKTVRAWAQAWAKKDVDAYLGFYARDFKTPGGQARGEWEKVRRQRVGAPKRIEVEINSPKVSIKDANNATVTFLQLYRSDAFKGDTRKTLVMMRVGGKWLIHQERVGN